MKYLLLLILAAASLLAAKKPPQGGPQVISLEADRWTLGGAFFGLSVSPSQLPTGGLFFDFPDYSTQKYAGYLTTSTRPLSGGTTLAVTLRVITTGTPEFKYDSEPENTWPTPATVRPYFRTSGEGEYDRWWVKNPVSYTLAAGEVTLYAPLVHSQWISLYGRDSVPASVAGFENALRRTSTVGLTFGGGFFLSHGVSVLNGTAQFQVLDYRIQ